MKVEYSDMLYDYLIQSDKVTLKQEKLLGFPTSPKQVGKLVHEAKKELEELKTKATAYDSKEVQDAIECDRIEKILLNKRIQYILCCNPSYAEIESSVDLLLYSHENSNVKTKIEGKTKLEALTKALEWVEGRG